MRPRSEDSKQAIFGAALELLRERTYRDVTTDAIAAAAGVGKQTIYRWWKTKADVVLDALADSAREIVAEKTGELAGDVRAFFEATFRVARAGTARVLKGLMAEAQLDAAFATRFAAFIGERRSALREVLTRHVRASADVEAMVDMLFGAFWYRILIEHAPIDASFATRLGKLAASGLTS